MDAARDLGEICDYFERHDSLASADHVLDRIEKTFADLSQHSRRGGTAGHWDSGVPGGFFKPYRIIYRVIEDNVYVMVIADGRRAMRTLLEQRLLQA